MVRVTPDGGHDAPCPNSTSSGRAFRCEAIMTADVLTDAEFDTQKARILAAAT